MSERLQIVMAGTADHDLTKLAEYRAVGGYEALAKARAITPGAVTDELLASELRGRGGAFFPTGRKWSFVPKPEQNPNPHYLVVNADESEPGSFKDSEIISRVPHRLIEGCLITAHAVEAKTSTSTSAASTSTSTRSSSPRSRRSATLPEISRRRRRSSSTAARAPTSAARRRRCSTRSRASAASRARSRRSRRSPGLYASPTVDQQRRDDRHRPADHRAWAARSTRSSASRTRAARAIFSRVRQRRAAGNYEIEPGVVTLRELIYADDSAAGSRTAAQLKAVIPGGSSMP